MKISTESEYNAAILEIDDLIDCPDDDQVAMNRLEQLSIAVEEYEEIHYPIEPATPEMLIDFCREQNPGMSEEQIIEIVNRLHKNINGD